MQQSIRSYRFYFLDGDNHIAKAWDIESSSDTEACELAALMLADQVDYPCIEVWDRARKVQCRPTAPQLAKDEGHRFYRTTAQRLWRMARTDEGLGAQLRVLSHEIDQYANKLQAA